NQRRDERRILFAQIGSGKPECLQSSGRAVRDEYIRPLQDLVQQTHGGSRLQIQSDALLVRVQEQEQPAFLRVGSIARERPVAACIVASAGGLYLDHTCTHVGEQLSTVGRGDELAELDDGQSLERTPAFQVAGTRCYIGHSQYRTFSRSRRAISSALRPSNSPNTDRKSVV